jgi:uncharacterized protein involved in exopolysaccharide biosynthesis
VKPERKQSKAVTFSEKIYCFLLRMYPAEHRREYGASMVQLFRDQCRDASREVGWRGLVMLWFRTLLDLVKTSALERLAALKGREFLFKSFFIKTRSPLEAVITSFVISAVIFLLVVAGSACTTLLTSDTYSATARLKVEQPGLRKESGPGLRPSSGGHYDPYLLQAEWMVVQSPQVLLKVSDNLWLNEIWGERSNRGVPLKTAETLKLLRQRINVRTFRNGMVEIRVYSPDKKEAARIANEIAKVYQEYRSGRVLSFRVDKRPVASTVSVQIVELAQPAVLPTRPNHYLDIFIGAVVGAAVGGGLGISFLMMSLRRVRVAM